MRRVVVLAGLLGLSALLLPARAAWSDSPSSCAVHGSGGGPSGLAAVVFSTLGYDVPGGTTSVSGTAALPLQPSWNLLLGNNSPAAVTNATIDTASGLDPSVFDGQPRSCGSPSLDPGTTMSLGFAASGSVQDASLGYDSSAVASPNVVPAAGGEVTEIVKVTLTDPRFAGAGITVSTGNGDVAVVSQAVPSNLDQGESISAAGGEWDLSGARLDKTYVFTARVDVGAAGAASAPYVFSPPVSIQVGGSCGAACSFSTTSTGASVSVQDSSLDGSIAFSVDQSAETWNVFLQRLSQTRYAETTTPLSCKNGGWRTYGIFKNQGDCVSYVATGGRNPPGGPPRGR